ncbi:MAG: altronate dehydratase family protein [Synergistaceae bacterium]|jgi:altronate hydrolase|nr:altronate dehydratase family protein [Synergistaceae bacterium]
MKFSEYICLNNLDNVLILPRGGEIGSGVDLFTLNDNIPAGHKAAGRNIATGEPVIKYGHTIGAAARDIKQGDWVHEHNVTARLRYDDDEFPAWGGARAVLSHISDKNFMGYRRYSGRPGVRNDLWVIPTVGCISEELRSILKNYHKPYWIDAVKLLEHTSGYSQIGEDLDLTLNILVGLAQNPNAAGVLLVGHGGESLTVSELNSRLSNKDLNVMKLTLQETPNPADSLNSMLDELASLAPRVREEFPISEICVGIMCRDIDRYSGLTANPLVGRFSDFLTKYGGVIVAAGIPEMFGASGAIVPRISSKKTYENFISRDRWFRDYLARRNQPIGGVLSPSDKVNGITTAEEKSLVILENTGSAFITGILKYGEQADAAPGVQIVFSSGNDLISSTSLAGSGAQIILCAAGRDTSFGAVTPTLKISTNTDLARRHPDWADFDAGTLLDGESWESVTERLIECVLRAASGEYVSHEKKGFWEIAVFDLKSEA